MFTSIIRHFGGGYRYQLLKIKDILIYLLLSFILLGFVYIGSIEIFFNNWKEYGYNFIAFFKIVFKEYFLYSLLLSLIACILSIIHRKVKAFVDITFIVLLFFSLINLAFFPVEDFLDGREYVKVKSFTGIINILLFFATIFFAIIIYIKSKDKNKPFMFIILLCSVYIAITTFSSISNTSYKSQVDNSLTISTLPQDILKLSKEKNIIYIVLDQFDSSYFNKILAGNDGGMYREMFADFTYFKEYASAHPTTVFNGVASMAGKPYDNSMPYSQFRQKVFSEGYSLFEKLQSDGYDNIAYFKGLSSDVTFFYAPQISLYSNVIQGIHNTAPEESIDKYLQASIYRFSPFFLRNKVKQYMAINDKKGWDFKFLNMIKNNRIITNNNNTFMLLHLAGTHDPHTINENMELDKKATAVSQGKASLKLVKLFLEKIKNTSQDMYDNSVIIITTDHGFWKPNALCLIKPMNYTNNVMVEDNRPLYQVDMKDIIQDLLNGKQLSDIKASTERYFYHYLTFRETKGGYFETIYKYKLPEKLLDNLSYELVDTLNPPDTEIINTKRVEVSFPADYETLPKWMMVGGTNWQNTSEGLVTDSSYHFISFLLEKNKNQKANVEIEYESATNKNNLYIRTYDINNKEQKRYGAYKLDGNTFQGSYDVSNAIMLQFNAKDKITIKKITIELYD